MKQSLLNKSTNKRPEFICETNTVMKTNITKEQLLEHLSEHKDELRKRFGVRTIGLFGSYARGEAGDESDIDIVVELEKPDLFHLVGIKLFFQESLGHRVDVVRMRENMNESLRLRIVRDAVYV